jgi:hypothetical protein
MRKLLLCLVVVGASLLLTDAPVQATDFPDCGGCYACVWNPVRGCDWVCC